MNAIFLDKDGTLIDDIPYNVAPHRMTLCDGAGPALRLLSARGYRLFVVSNQDGIGNGRFTEATMVVVGARLSQLLATEHLVLAGFYYCPHHPRAALARYACTCNCRKPAPGMLLRAARQHGIDLAASWMIGDILHDVEAGNRAGCRSVLLDKGHETEWLAGPQRTPTHTARDLPHAAQLIAAHDGDCR
ncbi:MAG: family hydrolase [Massilia sp.]|nr:family hydrolase [Massilia sp.]